MATHRGSSRASWPRLRAKADRMYRRSLPRNLVAGPGHGMVSRSAPFTLSPDHHWRGVPCMVCRITPGDRPVMIVTIVDPRIEPARRWQIGACTYLVCEVHDQADDATLTRLAHQLEQPGCPCNTLSPNGTSAYPHHLPHQEAR